MAASITPTKRGALDAVNSGFFDTSLISFDGDSTVELDTTLSYITTASFTRVGSGGSTYVPTLDATHDTGHGIETTNGFVTVDVPAPTSDQWVVRIQGY